MTTTPGPVADGAHGLGPTRARVLGALQDLRNASSAGELAQRLGIHLNTARFHLDALVTAGLVERVRADRRGPGRPQVHYAPTRAAPQVAHRSYRLLAEILSQHLARRASDPHGEGIAAGRDYGRLIVAASGPADLPRAESEAPPGVEGAPRAQDAVNTVVETLDRLGFDSRRVPPSHPTSGDVLVEVTNCPFLEVAEGHLDIVCAVHRGIMDGMLDELGAPVRVERLDPLVAPSRCVARFTSRPRRRIASPAEPAPR